MTGQTPVAKRHQRRNMRPGIPSNSPSTIHYLPMTNLWQRYNDRLCRCPSLGLTLDTSRMDHGEDFDACMAPKLARAFEAMDTLESGAIANPTEQRMVGHYWLRDAERAPTATIRKQIESNIDKVKTFASRVHDGRLRSSTKEMFTELLLIGIGGSALGPQLIADALGGPGDVMTIHYLDNTDPDGFARTIATLGDRMTRTLALVVSKSGGTPETRNGMLEAQAAFAAAGLPFAEHAVAVTGVGSALDKVAKSQKWLARFPMWDWVGGRTSVTAAVGLLPAALQGLDIDAMLGGAAKMDALTRMHDAQKNPAARLALMWYHATDYGRGRKDMVILPYKDRLALLSRYLQQLIMESLGKRVDLDGQVVNQGISVYGNKGSTDQHAYVQQLREGLNNFFVTFVQVLKDQGDGRRRAVGSVDVGDGHTSGDYLTGFYLGTRTALYEAGRESMTITIDRLDARSLGALIALYERAVGLYATMIHINAYDQPGVEAGKKAAATVLDLKSRALSVLAKTKRPMSLDQIAKAVQQNDEDDPTETLHHLLTYLAANKRGVAVVRGKYKRL